MSIHQPIGELLLDKDNVITLDRLEAGDIIIEYLKELEVEYIYGVPGGAIEPLFNALARNNAHDDPKTIIARHEAGSVFMADGYARESGKIGACIATSGPGATNMITGIASAYQDKTPLLVITGQSSLETFGSFASQESSCTAIDTVAMFKHCTVYSSLVSHPEQLERKLVAAIGAAYQHRRPAHLSIPMDIARQKYNRPLSKPLLRLNISSNNTIDLPATQNLIELLESASQPVFVVGEGCREAISDILAYIENSNSFVVTTPQGKGLVNPYHMKFYGVCGMSGHKSASDLLNSTKTDLIIIVGSALDQLAISGWSPSSTNSKTIHIDSELEHFNRSQYAILNVAGNIKLIFKQLNKAISLHGKTANIAPVSYSHTNNKPIPFERRRLERRKLKKAPNKDLRSEERRGNSLSKRPLYRNFQLIDELKYLNDESPIKPQRLMYELSSRAPQGTQFLADIGNSFLWAIHYLNPYHNSKPRYYSYLYMGMGFASMAWSIGAAIGVKQANPDKSVICIVGDGAMLMSAHELTVAVQCNLPVIYILLNDQAYGTCKHGQKMAGAQSIGSELPFVDFAAYAKTVGANGIGVKTLEEFSQINFKMLNESDKPTLIDVRIDGNEPPPLSERLKMLASGRD